MDKSCIDWCLWALLYTQTSHSQTVAHNEQFVVDVLNRQQPFHDHSYTTVFGKRVGIETLQLDSETLDQLGVEEDTARTAGEFCCNKLFQKGHY